MQAPAQAIVSYHAGGVRQDGLGLDRLLSPTHLALLRHALDVSGSDPKDTMAVHLGEGMAWIDRMVRSRAWVHADHPCAATMLAIRRRVDL